MVLPYVTKARFQDGYLDMAQEHAILDTRRLFGKSGVSVAKAEAGIKVLTRVSKVFEGLAEKCKDSAVGNAERFPVLGHKEGIEEERPEPEGSDDDYEYIVALTGIGSR